MPSTSATSEIVEVDAASITPYTQSGIQLEVGFEIFGSVKTVPGLENLISNHLIANTEHRIAETELVRGTAKVEEAKALKIRSEAGKIDSETNKNNLEIDHIKFANPIYKIIVKLIPFIGLLLLLYTAYFMYEGVREHHVYDFTRDNWLLVLALLTSVITCWVLPFTPLVQNFAQIIAKIKGQGEEKK